MVVVVVVVGAAAASSGDCKRRLRRCARRQRLGLAPLGGRGRSGDHVLNATLVGAADDAEVALLTPVPERA